MGYIMVLLLILIVFAAIGVFVSRRFAPSKAQADLASYYNMTAYSATNRQEAAGDELAVIIDDKVLDNEDTAYFRAVKADGEIYLAMPMVKNFIDSRYYHDINEDLVIFTNAERSFTTSVGSTIYNNSVTDKDAGYVIAKMINDEVYLNIKFVTYHSPLSYDVFSNPARLYLKNESGTVNYCTAGTELKMRVSANKKSSIVTTVPKNAKLKVIDKEEGWLKVVDEKGYFGYIQSNFASDVFSETLTSDYTEPEYTHITLDEKINMVWHGIYYYESSQYIADYTSEMTGVNVLAPTWFLFGDEYGSLTSYAYQDYVDYAHEHGWYVWAVLEDMDGNVGSCVNIITYTSKRKAIIEQMISECLSHDIDGINVDLETVTTNESEDFIQFIRELSVACRYNGLVLSVCDYAPYKYNAYRHTDEQSRICDYVAIMAYDDYVGENEAGPNAGLPFLEEVMGLCQNTVDMSRLIVGVPFYTRLWYKNSDGSLDRDTRDMSEILDIQWNHGLTFEWQGDVGYDYAEYETDGTTVKIWYENAKSLEAKMKTIHPYDVAGIAAWRLGQETSDVWEILEQYY